MTSDPGPENTSRNSIEIDAPPARVWEIVSEVRNAPKWSAQAVRVLATGGPTDMGTRSLNINRQGPVFWPTTSRVVEFEPERRIANRIGGHGTVWSFDLEPTPGGGTLLSQRQDIPAALTSIAGAVAARLPGGRSDGDASRRTGPSSSLRRIKDLAERG